MARKLGREDLEVHKEFALAYLALQEVEKAAEHYHWAIADEIYPELAYDYASVLIWLGRYKDSLPYLDYVLEQEPHHWEAYLERAEALAHMQDFETALADLKEASDLMPNQAEIWFKACRNLCTDGKLEFG